MNITKSELSALKLSLMTEHSIGTRGLSDGAIIDLAYKHKVITAKQAGKYTGLDKLAKREEQPTTPTQQDTEQMTTTAPTNTQAELLAQLMATIAPAQGGLTEQAVIELINKHSPVKQLAVATTAGATVNIDNVVHECFERALQMLAVGNDLYFYGRSGAGKSTTAKFLAKALDVPFFAQGSILAKFEALGSLTANGYNKSVIRQWLESDGGLLCIDEIDGSCPRALVTIMSIFDEDGRLTFPDGETLQRTDKHRVVLTANTVGAGANAQYNGRARLDKATLNRFVYIEHDYSKQVEDSMADKSIVKFGRALRKEIEKKGLDGALITPRTFKQAQKVFSSSLDKIMKTDLIGDCFKQALTTEQYRSACANIPTSLTSALAKAIK